MAEWSKAAVLKTVVPLARDRGFESYSLRQFPEGDPIDGRENSPSICGEMAELAEGARLLSECGV